MTFDAILADLLAATGATRVTLRLDTPGRDFPAVAEALAPGAEPIRHDESIAQRGAPTAQWLFREQRPLIQDDVLVDEPRPPQGLIDAYGVRAQMLSPLVREGQVLGWVSVHQAGAPRRWSEADVAALEEAVRRALAEV